MSSKGKHESLVKQIKAGKANDAVIITTMQLQRAFLRPLKSALQEKRYSQRETKQRQRYLIL